MKKLNLIFCTLFLCTAAIAGKGSMPTLKEQMQVIHDHFGVNFIYDSSLELDVPSAKKMDPRRHTLEECLTDLFEGTDIEWSIQKKYIVLTHKDRKRRPKDYTIFIEEQRDTLNESMITALTSKDLNTTQTGHQKLDRIEFERGFAVLSSPDVIKTLQQLPGVATGTELLSGMYVRGGDGADNLYLLDGVPLYQVSHLAGLFSSFNTDVVESVDFYKSGFPARYGGRMSSVVDVRTREGDYRDWHGLFSMGLIDSRLQFEGPIVKGKTSFNIGLRRSWLDAITEPASLIIKKKQESDFRIKYAFWDFNGKITHKFSEDNRLSLNLYGGRDALKYNDGSIETDSEEQLTYIEESRLGLEWGNLVASLDWDYRFEENHEVAAKIYFSRYGSRFGVSENTRTLTADSMTRSSIYESYNHSRISDICLRADFSFRPGDFHHIRYGSQLEYHFHTPEYTGKKESVAKGSQTESHDLSEKDFRKSFEPSVYIEDEMTFSDRFTANIGIRYSAIVTKGKTWHSIQPRAALRFGLGDYTSLKLSYSEMTQNNHRISSNYLELPTGFWMPSTEKTAPEKSRQVSAGVYVNFPLNIRFNAEGYFKTMDNILEFSGKWGIYPPVSLWEEAVTVGKGRSWGLETEVSWSDENTTLAAYYTLSWSQRHFEEFFPEWYNDRNDNRHKLTLTATRRFGKRFEMYASWNWHSGSWMTAQSHAIWSEEMIDEMPELFYTRPNNSRLPEYHRLDLGFNFRKTTKRGNESIWNLSLYNAYFNTNPITAYLYREYNFTKENLSGLTFIGDAYGVIPIIPSFNYTLKF